MIKKAKEVLKKLEFGIVEFLLGALMVIGLIGYFAGVPADLDWIDHTVSFVLFSYLFYKLNVTSILFGKTSKPANLIIIVSYFSLFFKDIISYTKLDSFKFKIITFVNYFYTFLSNNLIQINRLTFYIGIAGLMAISFYITKKIDISSPSFLSAIYQRRIKNNLIKFLSIFVLLLGFYYFVYNTILEWLEFTIDDPVVATGVVFYVYSIAKHHTKFHANDFVFKIGDFSTRWYRRFVSLFHYKKTLPLAISGLLILHALSDLGVFAYSMVFLKENFYLEFLKHEHTPFLKLFLEDAKNLPSFAVMPLLIDYLLNALSLVTLLLIPIIVWVRMFSQKELHFNRIFLFFIYSSITAYLLLPGYVMLPLSELDVRGNETAIFGVDIISLSLLESSHFFYSLFPDKSAAIVAASLTSIIIGLAVYALSSKPKLKKEFYAISIIGGLAFYAVYIFYFFSSLLGFYDKILLEIFTPHFLMGATLAVFFALSVIFYIMGYFMFLYEIVQEYHKRKWSEPVDEELLTAIRKIRRFEMNMTKSRKSQFIGEVFKYGLVGVVSVIILIAGYGMLNTVKERTCKTEISKFEIDLKSIDQSLRAGAKELQSLQVPCKADKIYFFDLNKNINPEDFGEIPIMKETLKSKSHNVFLVKDGEVKRSFYAGNLEMIYPYHICFVPDFDKISFFAEGSGSSAKIAAACGQPECTFIPIEIGEQEAQKIISEMVEFGGSFPNECKNCPRDLAEEFEKAKLTRKNVEMFRKFAFCGNITDVQIIIKPKKGAKVKDFRFYEFIPKECIDDLGKYLAENIEGDVDIKGDPLIMWHFDEIGEGKKFSYKLATELSEECRQAIQGLGVAQFIEGAGQEKTSNENTPPTIGGIPDSVVSEAKLHKNVVPNLWRYAEDKETGPENLVYSVIDQTKPSLVECNIIENKHIDCEVKQNKDGISRITLEVSDLEFSDRTIFNVEVTQSCKSHARKSCIGNQAVWMDSCGNQESLEKVCLSNEKCEDGECQPLCTKNFKRRCDGNKVYWFDSCSKKGSLVFNCDKNSVKKKCNNGECCINLFGGINCEKPDENNQEEN